MMLMIIEELIFLLNSLKMNELDTLSCNRNLRSFNSNIIIPINSKK